MNARSFGKKGTEGGAPVVAARRTAFLATERAQADGESREAETEVFPARKRTIADRVEFVGESKREPVGPRSLKLAYALWLPFGLAGAHRFYLGRYRTGALQAAICLGCLVAAFGFQYYPAFAGLIVSWLWFLVDGINLQKMHAEAVGPPAPDVIV